MDQLLVTFDNVTLERDGQACFSGTTLSIAEGEHVVVLGGNGQGKATLAAAVAGFGRGMDLSIFEGNFRGLDATEVGLHTTTPTHTHTTTPQPHRQEPQAASLAG